jgi:hypothetical protein
MYSPELGYTFRSSKVLIDEKVRGGSIDLQLRNCLSGPQGTLNIMPDRKPRGWPTKEIPGITPLAPAPSISAQPDIQSTSKIVTSAFIPSPGAEKLVHNDMNIEDNGVNCEDIARLNTPIDPIQNQKLETQSKPPSLVLLPFLPVLTIEEVQEDSSEADSTKLQPVVTEEVLSLSLLQQDAPRYITRSKRKRSLSSADEDEQMHKIFRAMIAFYARDHPCSSTDESGFPVKEVNNIKIPKSYLDAIRDPSYAQEWQQAIQEELQSLKANGTWKEVVSPPSDNLVSMKWVLTVKTMVDGSIERFKASLVAREFSQAYGLDYEETFAPTVRVDTLRLFLAIVAFENLECWHFDIKNAFTESELEEKIFFQLPPSVNV